MKYKERGEYVLKRRTLKDQVGLNEWYEWYGLNGLNGLSGLNEW